MLIFRSFTYKCNINSPEKYKGVVVILLLGILAFTTSVLAYAFSGNNVIIPVTIATSTLIFIPFLCFVISCHRRPRSEESTIEENVEDEESQLHQSEEDSVPLSPISTEQDT